MSAVNVFVSSERAWLLTDSSPLRRDRRHHRLRLQGLHDRELDGPVVTGRGKPVGHRPSPSTSPRHSARSTNSLPLSGPVIEREHKAAIARGELIAQSLIQLTVVGWRRAGTAGPAPSCSTARRSRTVPPYVLGPDVCDGEPSGYSIGPEISLAEGWYLHRLGAQPGIDYDEASFDPIRHGVPLLEAQRRRGKSDPKLMLGIDRHVVGGSVDAFTIERDGVLGPRDPHLARRDRRIDPAGASAARSQAAHGSALLRGGRHRAPLDQAVAGERDRSRDAVCRERCSRWRQRRPACRASSVGPTSASSASWRGRPENVGRPQSPRFRGRGCRAWPRLRTARGIALLLWHPGCRPGVERPPRRGRAAEDARRFSGRAARARDEVMAFMEASVDRHGPPSWRGAALVVTTMARFVTPPEPSPSVPHDPEAEARLVSAFNILVVRGRPRPS